MKSFIVLERNDVPKSATVSEDAALMVHSTGEL